MFLINSTKSFPRPEKPPYLDSFRAVKVFFYKQPSTKYLAKKGQAKLDKTKNI